MCSGALATALATIGVSTAPGQTALMRMSRAAYSRAAAFVSPMTPCFEAVYASRLPQAWGVKQAAHGL